MIINFAFGNAGGGGGGTSYSAGQYIQISSNTISVTGITPDDYAMASALTEVSTALTEMSSAVTALSTALTEDEQVWASALTDLHTDISAVTAEMASKQARFTAATDTARDALTGMSEGDVCVVSEFYETVDSDTLYSHRFDGSPNWAIEQTVGHSYDYFAVKPVTNPNYDITSEGQTGMIIQYWYDNGPQYFDGIVVFLNSPGEYTMRYGHNTTDSSYTNWPTASTGNYYAIRNKEAASWGSQNWDQLIPNANSTMFPVVFEFYIYHPMTTYQYNNGAWIKLATADDVANVRQIAENAQSSANSKLTYGNLWLSSWADSSGFTTGVYDFTINNVNEGTRLHKAFITENEYNNPKIDEIVTSDSFLRVMKMTQDEYDNLQTKDPLVCYIIVENE